MTQFRMIESSAPQRLRISWEMLLPRDDNTDSPDQRDDGFFPSVEPKSPGYIGGPNDGETGTEYARRYRDAHIAAVARYNAWTADEWHFVGVVAKAIIFIPLGGRSFRVLEVESSGVWGYESDAPAHIHREAFSEQREELLAELVTMGRVLTGPDGTWDEELPE